MKEKDISIIVVKSLIQGLYIYMCSTEKKERKDMYIHDVYEWRPVVSLLIMISMVVNLKFTTNKISFHCHRLQRYKLYQYRIQRQLRFQLHYIL